MHHLKFLSIQEYSISQGRQSWGVGGPTPRFLAGEVVGGVGESQGGRGRVSENTIAYFAQKAGVKGENLRRKANLKRIFTFFVEDQKKGRQKFVPGK